jgi:hypothetical protein
MRNANGSRPRQSVLRFPLHAVLQGAAQAEAVFQHDLQKLKGIVALG